VGYSAFRLMYAELSSLFLHRQEKCICHVWCIRLFWVHKTVQHFYS